METLYNLLNNNNNNNNNVCSQNAAWCLVTSLYCVKAILVSSSVLTKLQV